MYGRDTGGGQCKGRYRGGGEVALFDAEAAPASPAPTSRTRSSRRSTTRPPAGPVSLLPMEPIWTMIRSGRQASGTQREGRLDGKTVVDGASSGLS